MNWSRILWCTIVLQTVPALAFTRVSERPASTPDSSALLVLPGAMNLEKRSQYGMNGVQYELDAPFPGFAAIQRILKHMSERGWTPLHEDWLNPGIPTSYVRSWTDFADHSSRPWVHRYSWSTSWKNSKGDIASYSLRYVLPDADRPPLARLAVNATVMPASLVEKMKAETRSLSKLNDTSETRSRDSLPSGSEPMLRVNARSGDAVLLSNHLGEAIVLLHEAKGRQISYGWRYREAKSGAESAGEVPLASIIHAGPFELFWGSAGGFPSGVTLQQHEMDVIPLPGEFFRTLDLGQIRRLASLTPLRDQRYRANNPSPDERRRARIGSFLGSASKVAIQKGQILFVTGSFGRGTAEFAEVDMNGMTCRWRFRDLSGRESSGTSGVDSKKGFDSFRIGPYEVAWMIRSVRSVQSAAEKSSDWLAEILFFPEELSVRALPTGSPSEIRLDRDPPP